MHITTQAPLGRLPSVIAAEFPQVHTLHLTQRERKTLQSAACIANRMRETVRDTYGDELAYEDPWIDLGIAASALEDAAADGKLRIYV